MERAKQAVSSFVSRDGKHKTTVDEDSRGAVTEERVLPHQHENVTTAVDKEVHQDHHHTTVQPVTAKETLPEQHTHNMMPVQHKTVEHGNKHDIRDTLDREAAQFKDSSVTHETTHSASTAPIVAGERTHHHVHEHVQPVIQKETVAPQVVHTTVPIHETHHATAVHHGTSVLPAESIETFNSGKGTLSGRDTTRVAEFEGCPKPYKNELQREQAEGDRNMHVGGAERSHARAHDGTSTGINDPVNTRSNDAMNTRSNDPMSTRSNDPTNTHMTDTTGADQSGNYALGAGGNAMGGGIAKTGSTDRTTPRAAAGTRTSDNTTTSSSQAKTKPSLMDKVNPMKDADGDGKKGLMD